MPERYHVGIVDVSHEIEEKARDAADARLSQFGDQTREIGKFQSWKSGEGVTHNIKQLFNGSFLRRKKREIWDQNLARDYIRNKEIAAARQAVETSGNLYANEEAVSEESSHKELEAVVNRFVTEFEDDESTSLIHQDAGEAKQELRGQNEAENRLKHEILNLVRDYAENNINADVFEEEKNRRISWAVQNIRHDVSDTSAQGAVAVFEQAHLFTDNLKQTADRIKRAFNEGQSLDSLLDHIDITLGRARMGARTEAQRTAFDRRLERFQKHPIGQWVSETTAAAAVAIAGNVAKSVTTGAVSKALNLVTFGAGTLVSGGVAGARENVRLKQERQQHGREMAIGREITANSPQRERMEQYRYEAVEASQFIHAFEEIERRLSAGEELTGDEVQGYIAILAEASARQRLSDQHKIDLIAFSAPGAVEQERTSMMINKAKVVVGLRNYCANHPDLDIDYAALSNEQTDVIADRIAHEGDESIAGRDRQFNTYRKKQVVKAAAMGIITGVAIGKAVQWVVGYVHGGPSGVPQGEPTHTHKNFEITPDPHDPSRYILLDKDTNSQIASGIDLVPDSKGAMHLSPDSAAILNQHGMSVPDQLVPIAHHETRAVSVTDKEYAHQHGTRIKRGEWLDHDTPMHRGVDGKMYGADKNELRLHVMKSGEDTVFSIHNMKPEWSYHDGKHINIWEHAGKDAKILVSISRETQNYVVPLNIDEHGQVIIPKDLAHEIIGHDEHGNPFLKARFAEVAVQGGEKHGVPVYDILATEEGKGLHHINSTVEHHVQWENHPIFDTVQPITPDQPIILPDLIPLRGRKPLEATGLPESPVAPEENPEFPYYAMSEEEIRRRREHIRSLRPSDEAIMHALEYANHDDPAFNFIRSQIGGGGGGGSEVTTHLDSSETRRTVDPHQAALNLLIDRAEVGKQILPPEFYENSPVVSGIKNAKEIVIVLDDPIGDAVLHGSIIDVLSQYLAATGQSKPIVVQVKRSHLGMFRGFTDRYPGKIRFEEHRLPLTLRDDQYVINAGTKQLLQGERNNPDERYLDPSRVLDLHWSGLVPDRYPITVDGDRVLRERIYGTIPGMMARNFEAITATKIFEDLATEEFRWPMPERSDELLQAIKDRAGIHQPYIMISPGSSIKPKQYSPDRWYELLQGLYSDVGWEGQVVVTEYDDELRAELQARLNDLPDSIRNSIVYVKENLENVALISKGATCVLTPGTGVGHLAGAIGTETVMMYSVANPVIWSVPQKNIHRVFTPNVREMIERGQGDHSYLGHNPEEHGKYITSAGEGLDNLDPAIVLRRIRTLIESKPEEVPVDTDPDIVRDRMVREPIRYKRNPRDRKTVIATPDDIDDYLRTRRTEDNEGEAVRYNVEYDGEINDGTVIEVPTSNLYTKSGYRTDGRGNRILESRNITYQVRLLHVNGIKATLAAVSTEPVQALLKRYFEGDEDTFRIKVIKVHKDRSDRTTHYQCEIDAESAPSEIKIEEQPVGDVAELVRRKVTKDFSFQIRGDGTAAKPFEYDHGIAWGDGINTPIELKHFLTSQEEYERLRLPREDMRAYFETMLCIKNYVQRKDRGENVQLKLRADKVVDGRLQVTVADLLVDGVRVDIQRESNNRSRAERRPVMPDFPFEDRDPTKNGEMFDLDFTKLNPPRKTVPVEWTTAKRKDGSTHSIMVPKSISINGKRGGSVRMAGDDAQRFVQGKLQHMPNMRIKTVYMNPDAFRGKYDFLYEVIDDEKTDLAPPTEPIIEPSGGAAADIVVPPQAEPNEPPAVGESVPITIENTSEIENGRINEQPAEIAAYTAKGEAMLKDLPARVTGMTKFDTRNNAGRSRVIALGMLADKIDPVLLEPENAVVSKISAMHAVIKHELQAFKLTKDDYATAKREMNRLLDEEAKQINEVNSEPPAVKSSNVAPAPEIRVSPDASKEARRSREDEIITSDLDLSGER